MARMVVHQGEVTQLLRSPDGPIGLDSFRRARRVQNVARRKVGVDTGRLRGDISVGLFADNRSRVGNSLPYARIHHDGRKAVVAKRGKALRFKAGGKILYRKRVKRAKGNPYLRDALPAAAD